MELEHLNNETFEKAIKGAKTPVLVDFFATWCGPCKMLAPILQAVQEEIGEKAKIYKLDVDEGMDIAKQFGVMSVPTMIIFKDGEEVDRLVGLRSKSEIITTIEEKY
ncbi:MAG: thioredoxin [Christensenellales bacterium]